MSTDAATPSASRALAIPLVLLVAAFALAFAAFQPRLLPATGTRSDIAKVVVACLALVGFALGYRRLAAHGDSAAARRGVLLGSVPLWLLAVLIPPYESVDLHAYTNIGHSQVAYGINPYSTLVTGIPGWNLDPLFDATYAGTPCAYSFLFAREAEAVVRLAGPDKYDIFLAFKLVNVVALALTLWVVAVGCARLGLSRVAGLYLVAWNPLVLLHGISNGHNDVLSGLALVAALLFAGSRLWWACMTALAAGALMKYSTIPLVPLAALFLARRHGWGRVAVSTLPAVAFTAWVAWPYLAGGGALQVSRSVSNLTDAVGSIGSVVVHLVQALRYLDSRWIGVEPVVANVLKFAGGLLVLGIVGWLARGRWLQREYTWAEFVRDVVLVQVVLVVASAKFFGWYLLMFWPAVAWLPVGSPLRSAAVAVGFAQIGSLTFLARANFVSPLVMIVLPMVWAYRTTRPVPPVVFAFPDPAVGGRRAA